MLILTRKQGESITIGDDIKVTVLGVYGRQVRLGVEAPLKVIVHREEVYLKIKEENRKARTIRSNLMDLARLIKGKVQGKSGKSSDAGAVEYRTGSRSHSSGARGSQRRSTGRYGRSS